MPCRRIQFHIIKKEYPQHTVVPIPSDYVVEADHIRCISDGGGRGERKCNCRIISSSVFSCQQCHSTRFMSHIEGCSTLMALLLCSTPCSQHNYSGLFSLPYNYKKKKVIHIYIQVHVQYVTASQRMNGCGDVHFPRHSTDIHIYM